MSPAHATPRAGDPRAFISQDALHVAPELIGLPLAGPWRRGAAFGIDGILVAFLSNAPGALFGLAAALVLFRAAARTGPNTGYLRRSVRLSLGFSGALVLFVLVVKGWGSISDRIQNKVIPDLAGDAVQTGADGGDVTVNMTGAQGLRIAGDVLTLRQSRDEAQARERAERIVSSLRQQGVAEADIRETITGITSGTDDKPWVGAAIDSVVSHLGSTDTAAAPTDSLSRMAARVHDLEREKAALATRLAAATSPEHKPGLVARASTLIKDDLGLGLGWMGLYFTATVALWQGRTPGKRLLGIRIVRLNGKPIGWWAAFERFGGYAAGVATGLLGFAQIFWDKNRQAIHDKISETAVVRD
jgi:hypothetical protein